MVGIDTIGKIWYNKDMFMTVTVSKNILREYSYAYGDNLGYN